MAKSLVSGVKNFGLCPVGYNIARNRLGGCKTERDTIYESTGDKSGSWDWTKVERSEPISLKCGGWSAALTTHG